MRGSVVKLTRRWRRLVALVAGPVALGTLAAVPITGTPAQALAAGACSVAFSANQWGDGNGGFTASITITNLGDLIDGWTLSFDLPGRAQLTQGWAAVWDQSGQTVTAEDMDWNAIITTGGQTSIGFNGTGYAGDPDQFVLNGTPCGDPGDGDPGDGDPGDGDPGDGDPGDGDPGDPSVPIGFGAATTGGAGGATVTVSSTDAFLSAIQSAEPLTVQVDGSIALAGMNRVASDKTIVGVGTSARLIGGGLNIRDVDNVIVRNLTISGSDDNISIDESTNVWVDHNDLSNADDGALDIKHAADFVTVSWNHFHDQDKNMLLGHSDNNAAEDVGHLRVTYHHNWFDGTNQRKSPGALRQPGARLQQLLQRQQRLRRRLHHGRRRPRRGQLLRERGRPLPLGRGQLRSRLAGGERQPLRQLGDG